MPHEFVASTGHLVPPFNPLNSNSHTSQKPTVTFSQIYKIFCSQDQLAFIFAALELKLQWQWNVGRNVADCFNTLFQHWTRSGFRKWVLIKNIKVIMSDDNPPGLGTKSVVEILSLILTLPSVQTKIRYQIVCRYKS